ncbi:KAP family P-loop NTPase fold protein [Bifidobacterium leontopitheci]|uniref:KAP family P-loop domain-containing protein n=1 Tax=Bifidobacterium leontopitheci TaxID=2650774 RepID=A0A6I1GHK8_9BIFI|nr:P-loop NTPase fold protein [Bifidobacterium leontopitheci]KAB7790192.1 KAP family P-loop domain-containing protein [Bifidobacterium leontopitheci]
MANETASEQPIMLADDQPISKQSSPIGTHKLSDLDHFGRDKLVKGVANLLEHNVPELSSMVFGLEGPWGCGKTSLKNMVIEQLGNDWSSNHGMPYPVIVDFNPWMFSSTENVTEMLFATIAETMKGKQSELKYAQENKRENAEKTTGKIADITSAASRIAATVSPDPAVKAIAAAIGASVDGFNKIRKLLKSDPDHPLALPQAHDELVKQLKLESNQFRMYVFIDEIDRLDDQSIINIFKSLKAVGDLPRTVYIPIYDRRIVTKALAQASRFSGSDYLDKIVQMPITMPAVPVKAATRSLDDIYWDDIDHNGFPSISECELHEQTLSTYITNRRDANRLQNAYALYSAVMGDETNSIDLFAITAIETFHPLLAQWIQRNKLTLTGDDGSTSYTNIDKTLAKYYAMYGESTNDYRTSAESSLIHLLFPKGLRTTDPDSNEESENPESRRIRFPQHFDTYFTLAPSLGDVPTRSEIRHWLYDTWEQKSSDHDLSHIDKNEFLRMVPHDSLRWYIRQNPIYNQEYVQKLLDAYRVNYPNIAANAYEDTGLVIRKHIDMVISALIEHADAKTMLTYARHLKDSINAATIDTIWPALIQLLHLESELKNNPRLVVNDSANTLDAFDLQGDLIASIPAMIDQCIQKSLDLHELSSHDLRIMLNDWNQNGRISKVAANSSKPWKHLALFMAYVLPSSRNDELIIAASQMPSELAKEYNHTAGENRADGRMCTSKIKPTDLEEPLNHALSSTDIPSEWTLDDFQKIAALHMWERETRLQKNDGLPISNSREAHGTIHPHAVWVENRNRKPAVVINMNYAMSTVDTLEKLQKAGNGHSA